MGASNFIPSYHTMTKAERDALRELIAARDVQRTPCQDEPWRWDENLQLSVEARFEVAERAARECREDCHAFKECAAYLAVSRNLRGVIAGQVLIARPGRPAQPKTPAGERQQADER